jgi:hypothetical protein
MSNSTVLVTVWDSYASTETSPLLRLSVESIGAADEAVQKCRGHLFGQESLAKFRPASAGQASDAIDSSLFKGEDESVLTTEVKRISEGMKVEDLGVQYVLERSKDGKTIMQMHIQHRSEV